MNCATHTDIPAAAYCQTCGKALCTTCQRDVRGVIYCEDCKRDVMGAIYCEPCIAARLQGAPVAGGPAVPPPIPPAAIASAPSPVFAGLLGFIPGVGAMYNGQFVKAFIHVVIFVMLIIGANNIHWAFGLMLAFFEFYMAFEAYKTAEAKRLGLPAPDPLGLDKMFGLQEPESHHPSVAVPPASAGMPAPPPNYGAPVPPPLQVEPPPPPAPDNAPIGAIVLIVLGLAFLLSNFGMFNVDRLWPLFLIGIGLWIAYKRINRTAPGGGQ